jgi:hypothetical protein
VGSKVALAVAAVLLAACPKKAGGPDEPAVVTCENVGGSIAQALAADVAQSTSVDPNAEAINRAVVAAVVESCTKDAWSASARSCFIDNRAEGEEKCRSEITDAQVQALDDRMDSAVAKAVPADCSELEPLIIGSLKAEIEQAPAAERPALEAKITTFAAAMGAMCTAGWSVEARTCVRDATRAGADAGRCARWLDEPQRKAYEDAVEAAFGTPPAGSPRP